MSESLQQIFNLLTTAPGNLAYHLALSFTILAALQASINNLRQTGFPQGRRMAIGLGLLLVLQLIQFAVAGLAWAGLLDVALWLPPVDRVVVLISALIIIWLWLAPEPSRLIDAAFSLLALLAILSFAFGLLWWTEQAPQVYYNATLPDWIWNGFALALLAGGVLGLLVRRPNHWGIGLATLALLLMGHLLHFLLNQPESDFSGVVRLAQLMAFPWLMTLPQRFAASSDRVAVSGRPMVAERQRHAANLQTFQEFINLLDQPADCPTMARLISQLMLADLCLLISIGESDSDPTVACGYNLIEEKHLEGFTIAGQKAPMIVNALRRGKPLRLPSSSTSSDLQALASGLRMSRVGHLLMAPIPAAGTLGLLLLSPFSNRSWGSEDQVTLFRYAKFLGYVIQRTKTTFHTEEEWNALQKALQAAEEIKAQLQDQVKALQAQLSLGDGHLAGAAVAAASQMEGGLSPALEEAASAGYGASSEEAQVSRQAYEELQAHLRFALEQIAELRHELAKASAGAVDKSLPAADQAALEALLQPEAQSPAAEKAPPRDYSAIAGLARELRQPMASILGYTDLLLGESIGILGAAQKKFLERVRVAVERMSGLVDELLELTSLGDDELKLKPQALHLVPLIHSAINEVRGMLQQKEVDIQMDVSGDLPVIQANADSLHQALVSLLLNAGARSPSPGEVRLKARVEKGEQETGFIMIQIADTGESIPPQELPRVFSQIHTLRKPRGDFSSQALDLATVKAIIEAHGGRIWVDSTPDEGATFSLLLPIEAE